MIRVERKKYLLAAVILFVFVSLFGSIIQANAASAPVLSVSTKTVLAGDKFDVTVKNAWNAKITSVKSGNTKVVTVSKISNTKIRTKAVSAGSTKVSVKVGTKNLSYTVNVSPAVSFSSVKSEFALGESATLSVNGGFSGEAAAVTSSNSKVISVSKSSNRKFVLKALKGGSAKITAKCSGESKTYSINVKVKIAVAKSTNSGDTSVIVSMLRNCGAKADIVTTSVNVNHYSGLVLPGGSDLNPKLYGESNAKHLSKGISDKNDKVQMEIAGKFIQAKKPVMGICRGCQLLNVYFKGSLNQNIKGHRTPTGSAPHKVTIMSGSIFYKIFGKTSMTVNSLHHQSIKRLGSGLKITAKAKDGTVEAIEHTTLPVIGFQWHPELAGANGKKVFKYFIGMCE